MSTRTSRRVLSLGAVSTLLAVLAVGAFVGPLHPEAAPQRKNYSSAAAPTSIGRGVFTTISISLKNFATSNTAFNAVRLDVPSVFEMGATTVSSGTFTVTGRRVQILNANIIPGATLVITQVVRAACDAPEIAPLWTTDVRQSNDFNGTLNKFLLNGTDASVTINSPCHGALVTCVAGDDELCQTGDFVSPAGNVANIVVNENDTVSGTLRGEFTGTTVQCDEYTSTSERLKFSMTVTEGDVSGLTKTVKVTQPTQTLKPTLADYFACFQAPYDFKAQLPSQLVSDFNNWDFTANTQTVAIAATATTPAATEYKGLLLPCQAGQGAPCVDKKYFSAGGTITMEIVVPIGDPFVSF